MRHVLSTVACAIVGGSLPAARVAPLLPNVSDSVKMVVIGDNGTGSREQVELAEQMAGFRQQCRYDLVLAPGWDQTPVTFLTSSKNCFLFSVLMVQFTGGL